MEELEENIVYAVMCHSCGTIGPSIESMKDAKKAAMVLAINYWNRRDNGKSDDLERAS